jgi:alanyl-tRNA synthetase
MLNSSEIRQSFVDFFVERGHRLSPSAPLIAHGDPTLLFINAGMVPFKNFFLGSEEPPAPRAVSVQKCMRVSGKHNDLENVGPSPRHHTFFEMLGNFSFGDYFKEDAIRFGWDLVTEVWEVPKERLHVTVFEEDDEAAELWQQVAGIQADRVRRCGAKDNFWAMGETGPCGPCSEIFVDLRPDEPEIDWERGSESGRYLEIWNLVFMQFERRDDGELSPLPNPSIDTGAGLERVAATLQGLESNYDSDLFRPILDAAAILAGTAYGRESSRDIDLRVVADHLRAVSFLLADGVIPSNEGRGYVLRRLLRRAVRHGMSLGFEEPFLHRLLPVVTEVMGRSYSELAHAQSASATTVEMEEGKFLETVALGSKQVQDAIEEYRKSGARALPGEAVFRFYDTFGLPLETIREIAEEEGFALDIRGFERSLEEQRSRSRAASADSRQQLTWAREALRDAASGRATRFRGYSELSLVDTRITAMAKFEASTASSVSTFMAGDEGVVILDQTPFYADAGGQLGDRGWLRSGQGEARVIDTRREDSVHYHFVVVERGSFEEGDSVAATVDREWREPTQRHHTATHLLQAALRHVLGPGVRQAGSLVAPDRLRFDFTHGHPLSKDEISRVEDLVNRWVLSARDVDIHEGRDFEEAVAAGAMALFGEKYGDQVRTVEVPAIEVEGEEITSLELCGGCHVRNSGEIGVFVITSERGVASGVRRIEARTGEAARQLLQVRTGVIETLSGRLEVAEDRLVDEVEALAERRRNLERELSDLRMKLVAGRTESDETEVAGIKVLAREVPAATASEIRNMADVLRAKIGSGVVVLAVREGGKVSFVTAVSNDLADRLHAGKLAQRIATLVGGRGGGRADFAQAGGKLVDQLPVALESVPAFVLEELQKP